MTPVRNLEPIEFDLLEGKPVPPGLSKAVTPVTALPQVIFDLAPSTYPPALQLTLEMKPKSDPERVALDILALIDELQEFDRLLGGSGIRWNRNQSEIPSTGKVRIVLTASELKGTAERFAKIAEFVGNRNTMEPPSNTSGHKAQSILKCEATVLRSAA